VARGRGSFAREAARTPAYVAAFGLIAYFGMKVVIKIEATGIRLSLVIAVFGVAFGAVSWVERQLRDGEPVDEGWPRWYSQFNTPAMMRQLCGAAATDGS
jgi:hypothetical protein